MRPIKLTVALALATAGCSAPFTYPDLAKAKDTYAHATKTGDPKQFPKEFDDAKKSIGAAQSAQDAQASFERGKDPSRERDLATEALYKAEIADGHRRRGEVRRGPNGQGGGAGRAPEGMGREGRAGQ